MKLNLLAVGLVLQSGLILAGSNALAAGAADVVGDNCHNYSGSYNMTCKITWTTQRGTSPAVVQVLDRSYDNVLIKMETCSKFQETPSFGLFTGLNATFGAFSSTLAFNAQNQSALAGVQYWDTKKEEITYQQAVRNIDLNTQQLTKSEAKTRLYPAGNGQIKLRHSESSVLLSVEDVVNNRFNSVYTCTLQRK